VELCKTEKWQDIVVTAKTHTEWPEEEEENEK